MRPRANIFALRRSRTLYSSAQLERIRAHRDRIVDDRQQRTQWECWSKDAHKTKLDSQAVICCKCAVGGAVVVGLAIQLLCYVVVDPLANALLSVGTAVLVPEDDCVRSSPSGQVRFLLNTRVVRVRVGSIKV